MESESQVELRGRAIVTHNGIKRENGEWKCTKDSGTTSCVHIKKAMELLPKDFTLIPGVGECGDAEIDLLTSTSVCSLGACHFP